MAKKIKVFIFQNAQYRIYLPYADRGEQLANVAFEMARKLNPDKNMGYMKPLKAEGLNLCHTIEVSNVLDDGFIVDDIALYRFGEVYRRL